VNQAEKQKESHVAKLKGIEGYSNNLIKRIGGGVWRGFFFGQNLGAAARGKKKKKKRKQEQPQERIRSRRKQC
jgi:hypothetical protein